MAEHRALQCLKALVAAIVAADTDAGENAELGRTTEHFEADAIDVKPGPDVPVSEFGTDTPNSIVSIQRAYVDLHVRNISDGVEFVERLYALRAQTHAAILTDPQLGLASIVYGGVRYGGTADFEGEVAGERIGSVRTIWDIPYKMSYSDATS